MQHFVIVTMERADLAHKLDESVFPNNTVYETDLGSTVFEIPLPRKLSEEETQEFAEKLTNYLTDEGYDDFDIEITTDEEISDEETYEGDEFFLEYGVMWFNEDETLDEADYRGRSVPLGKPMRGDVKKFKVYVRKPSGNIVKVNFGDPNMRIKKSNPARRRSFRARHNCDNPGPRHKARYWSCRKW